jgi:hypothetical protein
VSRDREVCARAGGWRGKEWRGVREVVLNAIAKGEREGGLRSTVEDMLEL